MYSTESGQLTNASIYIMSQGCLIAVVKIDLVSNSGPRESLIMYIYCLHSFSARTDHTEEERERIRHSLEILEKMSRAPDSKEEEQRRHEEKEQLRLWMIDKRHERMEEYKRYRMELREHEKKPFKPDTSSKFKVIIYLPIPCSFYTL